MFNLPIITKDKTHNTFILKLLEKHNIKIKTPVMAEWVK